MLANQSNDSGNNTKRQTFDTVDHTSIVLGWSSGMLLGGEH